MDSLLQAFNQKRDTFIKERTAQEIAVKEWGAKISRLDPAILQGIELPVEITLEAFVPEVYAENPRQAVYDEQYDKMAATFQKITDLAMKYYQEGLQCHQEYQKLSTQ